MTCLEKYLAKHPYESAEKVCQNHCPDAQGIMDEPEYCIGQFTDECTRCWNREIPGTEEKSIVDAIVQAGASAVKTGNAIQKLAEVVKDLPPVIKDSGSRQEFESGAVRDIQEGKGRCDLMPLDVVGEITGDPVIVRIADFVVTGDRGYLKLALDEFRDVDPFEDVPTMLLEVSKHFEEGAKKYGENNWQKGLPVKCYINSAVRHYLKWLRGDTDEPHDRAFCWNIMCAIWTCKHKPELNDYGKDNL